MKLRGQVVAVLTDVCPSGKEYIRIKITEPAVNPFQRNIEVENVGKFRINDLIDFEARLDAICRL